MKYFLRQILYGDSLPCTINIGEETIIGTQTVSYLENFKNISEQHALFQQTDNGLLYVRDFKSLNGIYVNGEKVGSRLHRLKIGDLIGFGVPYLDRQNDNRFVCILCIDLNEDEIGYLLSFDSSSKDCPSNAVVNDDNQHSDVNSCVSDVNSNADSISRENSVLPFKGTDMPKLSHNVDTVIINEKNVGKNSNIQLMFSDSDSHENSVSPLEKSLPTLLPSISGNIINEKSLPQNSYIQLKWENKFQLVKECSIPLIKCDSLNFQFTSDIKSSSKGIDTFSVVQNEKLTNKTKFASIEDSFSDSSVDGLDENLKHMKKKKKNDFDAIIISDFDHNDDDKISDMLNEEHASETQSKIVAVDENDSDSSTKDCNKNSKHRRKKQQNLNKVIISDGFTNNDELSDTQNEEFTSKTQSKIAPVEKGVSHSSKEGFNRNQKSERKKQQNMAADNGLDKLSDAENDDHMSETHSETVAIKKHVSDSSDKEYLPDFSNKDLNKHRRLKKRKPKNRAADTASDFADKLSDTQNDEQMSKENVSDSSDIGFNKNRRLKERKPENLAAETGTISDSDFDELSDTKKDEHMNSTDSETSAAEKGISYNSRKNLNKNQKYKKRKPHSNSYSLKEELNKNSRYERRKRQNLHVEMVTVSDSFSDEDPINDWHLSRSRKKFGDFRGKKKKRSTSVKKERHDTKYNRNCKKNVNYRLSDNSD